MPPIRSCVFTSNSSLGLVSYCHVCECSSSITLGFRLPVPTMSSTSFFNQPNAKKYFRSKITKEGKTLVGQKVYSHAVIKTAMTKNQR